MTHLEANKAMLQEQTKNLFVQNWRNKKDAEKLEQFGRRLCLWIDGVPTGEKETSEDVLQKVKSLCSDAEIDIPDMAYDQALRIDKAYNDKGTNKNCNGIIFCFSTFRHQTMVYRSKKENEQKYKNQSWFDKEKVYSFSNC